MNASSKLNSEFAQQSEHVRRILKLGPVDKSL